MPELPRQLQVSGSVEVQPSLHSLQPWVFPRRGQLRGLQCGAGHPVQMRRPVPHRLLHQESDAASGQLLDAPGCGAPGSCNGGKHAMMIILFILGPNINIAQQHFFYFLAWLGLWSWSSCFLRWIYYILGFFTFFTYSWGFTLISVSATLLNVYATP